MSFADARSNRLSLWSPVAVQEGGTTIDLSELVFEPVVDAAKGRVTVPGCLLLAGL